MIENFEDLRIEAEPDDLAELKEMLVSVMDPLDLNEVTKISSGRNNEPILIGIIVALGGATLTKEVFSTIRRWMEHKEIMERGKSIRLLLESDADQRSVTLTDLSHLIEAPSS